MADGYPQPWGSSAFLGEHLDALESDTLALNRALAVLTGYSLVRRTSRERTLSIHRLVQAVLQDAMGEQECAEWVQRAIQALNAVFPEIDHTMWEQCERLLPHVLTCMDDKKLQEDNLSIASLAHTTARYLRVRVRYAEAESLHQRALRIREATLGAEHPLVAQIRANYDLHLQRWKETENGTMIENKKLGSKKPKR